jgi:hypothetical protein
MAMKRTGGPPKVSQTRLKVEHVKLHSPLDCHDKSQRASRNIPNYSVHIVSQYTASREDAKSKLLRDSSLEVESRSHNIQSLEESTFVTRPLSDIQHRPSTIQVNAFPGNQQTFPSLQNIQSANSFPLLLQYQGPGFLPKIVSSSQLQDLADCSQASADRAWCGARRGQAATDCNLLPILNTQACVAGRMGTAFTPLPPLALLLAAAHADAACHQPKGV